MSSLALRVCEIEKKVGFKNHAFPLQNPEITILVRNATTMYRKQSVWATPVLWKIDAGCMLPLISKDF